MDHRRHRAGTAARSGGLAAVTVLLLVLTGCGSQLSAAEKASQCVSLAADLASQGLSAVPSEQQARELGNRLDARLSQLGDPSVHDAAVALHSHVHGIEEAAKKGDTAKAKQQADEARKDIGKAARACGLPESQFIGG